MDRPYRAGITGALAVALGSCTPPPIEIGVSELAGRQVVNLTQDWGTIFIDRKPPCVGQIMLRSAAATDRIAWQVETTGVQCTNLGSFAVGVAPPGFRQIVALGPGSRGDFDLEIWGIGAGKARLTLR